MSQSCYLSIFLLSTATSGGLAFQFLNWGDKCTVPLQGGDDNPITEECDAGKGLWCVGAACDCIYKQRYSYDPVSNECRRKVGKPCQYMDLSLYGEEALHRLPFNLKCHENARCAQLDVPVRNKKGKYPAGGAAGGVVDIEKISMCICKEGFVPSSDLNECVIPPAIFLPQGDIFNKSRTKLVFRTPYYTR